MRGASRLALGTVQFGMPYGVTHGGGRAEDGEIVQILSAAAGAGIDMLDTAAGYGEAEDALGRAGAGRRFRIVTKTLGAGEDGPTDAVRARIEARFRASLDKLAARMVDGALIHTAGDLMAAGGGALWEMLEGWRDQGLTRRIGVSVYDRSDLDAVLDRFHPDLVQLPLNALDQRLLADGSLDRLASRGIAVHVRSAFLQGLLLTDHGDTPQRMSFLEPDLVRWREACREAGCRPAAAALAFAMMHPAVERVVVGVQTAAQLAELATAADAAPPSLSWSTLAAKDPTLLDPRRWPKA